MKARGAWPPTALRAPRRSLLAADERSVSDVLGSVLMVGITVLMAAAFGGLLLAYDGPDDTQHTQLFVSVGPGADGDWGSGDAELLIRHIGGEPLFQGDVTIDYTDLDGDHSATPTFTGGRLDIGDEWVQVISASPGDDIDITVIVDQDGGAALLSSGSVAAGGAGATLTYVTSITPASGKGAIQNPANAQVADTLAANLTEGAVGGTPTTVALAPASATTSGGSNTNVLSSNDIRSALDNSGEWVQGTGFTAPAGYSVSALSIGMEARAVQPVSTVSHVSTVTGSATSGSTVSTVSTLPISTGDVYVAAIANGNSPLRTVTGVSGPCAVPPCSGSSGVTWTLVGTQANSAGDGRLEVWVGTGTPSAVGFVTATFSGSIDRAGISVSRYSGADTSSPIQASLAGEANGNGGSSTVSLGTVAGTATTGVFFAALNGISASGSTSCSFTSPTNERSDFDPGGNKVQLCTAGGTAAATGNTLSATLGSNADWQAIILTLRPYATPLPSASLSYTFTGTCSVGCTTTLTQALTTTEANYTVSIIGNHAWSLADIAGLTVRVTYPSDTGSDVEVDRVYLSLTYASTPTTYTTQADLAFGGVPAADSHIFQMRYKVTGDTFQVYAMTGSTERLCPGTLNAAAYAVFTCTLSSGEYASGSPVLRVKDVTQAGTTLGTLAIEYARVSSA